LRNLEFLRVGLLFPLDKVKARVYIIRMATKAAEVTMSDHITSTQADTDTFYRGGDLCAYTGKFYGLFYEFTWISGSKKGKLGLTQRSPWPDDITRTSAETITYIDLHPNLQDLVKSCKITLREAIVRERWGRY
jgi:hypothetical protein